MKKSESKKPQTAVIRNSTAEFLVFAAQNEADGIEVRYDGETLWLTQKTMAQLFNCSSDNISLHIKNIIKEGELPEKSVAEEFSVTDSDGKNYRVKHYNLDRTVFSNRISTAIWKACWRIKENSRDVVE